MNKNDRKNAYLYCRFRDEQYALYDEYAKKNGLSMKTLLVLNALYYAKDGMTQKEVCERTFNSKQTVNLIIKNMLQEQYITIEEDPADKRNKFVKMTEKGKAYAKDIVVHITWSEDTAMSLFTPEEQEQFVELSRRFTKNLTDLINGNQGDTDR